MYLFELKNNPGRGERFPPRPSRNMKIAMNQPG
jgi:hypothetical protein